MPPPCCGPASGSKPYSPAWLLPLIQGHRKEYEKRDAALSLPGGRIIAVDQIVAGKALSFLHDGGDMSVTAGHSRTMYIERHYVCLATPIFLSDSKAAARLFTCHKCYLPNWWASIPRNCIAMNQAKPNFLWKRQRKLPLPLASAPPGLCMGRRPSPEGRKSTRQCRPDLAPRSSLWLWTYTKDRPGPCPTSPTCYPVLSCLSLSASARSQFSTR